MPNLTVALSGDDTLQINNQIISTLANQDPASLTFPNDIAVVEQGKNGTTIYAQNNMGFTCELVMRILLGGFDDKLINSLLQQQISNFSDFTLLTGVFTKRVGNGAGDISSVVYQLSGGIIKKGIEQMTSARGDANQSVAVWNVTFGNWVRQIV